MLAWWQQTQVLGIKFSQQVYLDVFNRPRDCLLSVSKVIAFFYHLYDAPSGLVYIWRQHDCVRTSLPSLTWCWRHAWGRQVDLLQMWGASSRSLPADAGPVDVLWFIVGDSWKEWLWASVPESEYFNCLVGWHCLAWASVVLATYPLCELLASVLNEVSNSTHPVGFLGWLNWVFDGST